LQSAFIEIKDITTEMNSFEERVEFNPAGWNGWITA